MKVCLNSKIIWIKLGGVSMKEEVVNPIVGNFVKSLRDIGYSFEVAVADVLDNSVTASAENINILCLEEPEISFSILDDGWGMEEEDLVNAMRLATYDPDQVRDPSDLGRFGLGLKTASFSQCRKLTVLSKRNEQVSIKRWDLDYISEKNEWLLLTPEIEMFRKHHFFEKFQNLEYGTLVIWDNIDSFNAEDIVTKINDLHAHLSLVFHYFLEGKVPRRKKMTITINGMKLEPFNPFNPNHKATQEFQEEKINFNNYDIKVQPYILPHHSKLSKTEFDRYATVDGYTKSQGFYLYRGYRLLIHGTWWGLHKLNDTHRLVRIKIEIPTNKDSDWGIDVKKSVARPTAELRKDLKRIIQQVTIQGARPYTKRGKRMTSSRIVHFWNQIADNENIRFAINGQHPLVQQLKKNLNPQQTELFNIYLKSLEAYLPIDSIVAQIHANPHKVKQDSTIEEINLEELVKNLKANGLTEETIEILLNTEIFSGEKGGLLK